ncbi:MAG: mechanosensitive ion channel family protein [Paludibacteraceae bacterium]|nr:mechanosensitive ion channel family protein [Paludibacteraceae bacterium]
MKELVIGIQDYLFNIGLLNGDGSIHDKLIGLLIIIILTAICDIVCRQIAMLVLHIHSKLKKKTEEESTQHKKLLKSVAAIFPAFVINIFLPLAFEEGSDWYRWINKLCNIYILVMIALFLSSLVSFIRIKYTTKNDTQRNNNNIPLTILYQIIKYIIVIISIIIGASILLDKSPQAFLTGLGASAAVLTFIFKDTILSLVAGIQLISNKMLQPGDWITIPKHNINGRVKKITINTVKIKNFDNTTITIPPSTLLNDSFQNWKTMEKSGARRIMRSINIDMHSIHFCSADELKKIKSISLMKPYLEKLNKNIVPSTNKGKNKSNEEVAIDQNPTNLELFTYYLETYITQIPSFVTDNDNELLHMVRQLQPTENGLPIEIYFFTSEYKWKRYEKVQSDTFAHILAMVNYFGLSVVQRV